MTNLSSLDYLENYTISKTITDRMWTLDFTLDKDDAPTSMMGVRAFGTDYADVEHCLFVGFIPGANYIRKITNDKVSITAYDFSWYLTAQPIPKTYWDYDMTGIPDYDVFYELIGGANSMNVTGITLGNTPDNYPQKIFTWSPKTTKMQAFTDIAERTDTHLIVNFEDVGGGVYETKLYVVANYEIATCVPAKVTFTNPSDYVMDLSINENLLEKYNKVTGHATNTKTGEWFTATVETAEVTAGEEKPIEYSFLDPTISSQGVLDDITDCYFVCLNGSAATYTATLTNRYDLRLFQLVKFVGYSDIPEEDMRITSITYQRTLNDDKVIIGFCDSLAFYNSSFFSRHTGVNYVQTEQQIIDDRIEGLAHLAIGEVTAVDGNEATVVLERSNSEIKARILT